jgi:hypothetical protein
MYIDPGALMPLVSGLAAVVGAVLMFWRRVVDGLRAGVRAVASRFSRSIP